MDLIKYLIRKLLIKLLVKYYGFKIKYYDFKFWWSNKINLRCKLLFLAVVSGCKPLLSGVKFNLKKFFPEFLLSLKNFFKPFKFLGGKTHAEVEKKSTIV